MVSEKAEFLLKKTKDRIMIQKRLQLFMDRMPDGVFGIKFKTYGLDFRIPRMQDGLAFVAEMEQHRRAVISGGGRELSMVLVAERGMEWLMECRCFNRVVAIDIWKQTFDFHDTLDVVFSWDGSVGEFDVAVKKLVCFFEKNK